MRVLFGLIIFLGFASLPVSANVFNFTAPESYSGNSFDSRTSTLMNSDRLNEIEYNYFGRNFANETTLGRLKRLESRIFGTSQTGTNSQRINRIISYTNSAKKSSFRRNLPPPDPRHSKRFNTRRYYPNSANNNSFNKTRHGLRNISKLLFGGNLTGYSPPVQMDPYYANNYGNYQNPIVSDPPFQIDQHGREMEYCDSYGNCYSKYGTTGSSAGVKIIY